MMKKWQINTITAIYVILVTLLVVSPALAHDAPPGDEYELADWMLLSFLIFFGAALVGFLYALRRGFLSNLENAKYYLLSIDEQDFYTPDWAKEDEDTGKEDKSGPNGRSHG